jgi:hypothetical protein
MLIPDWDMQGTKYCLERSRIFQILCPCTFIEIDCGIMRMMIVIEEDIWIEYLVKQRVRDTGEDE